MLSPLTVTLVQSTILNAISNILAQLIDQRNNTTPFVFKILPFLQFITYGLLSVPMNFYWQHAVEAYYPGFPSRADFANIFRGSRRSCSVRSLLWSLYSSPSILLGRSSKHRGDNDNDDDDEKKPKRWAPRARPSGLHNFTMKFLVDQTVAGVINIVLFLVLINYLQGGSWTRGWELVQEDLHPIMIARLKYRPIVSILMYTLIPVDRRVVFGSACGIIWGVYLSLYAVV